MIVKYLIRRIEPARFRSYIERTIESKGKLNYQTRADLFPLVSTSLMEKDFWERQMDKDSSNNTRRFESRTSSRKKLECFNCKGEHKAAVCPKRAMDYPIRNGQRLEGIRNGFNSNTKRGDQSAKAGATRPNSKYNGDDRASRTTYGLRQNPRATVRFDASSDSTEKKTAEKARRIVKDEESPKYDLTAGWRHWKMPFKHHIL